MDLLSVVLGGVLAILGGLAAAVTGAKALGMQSQKQIEQEWRRIADADLREFQESVIGLMEAI